MILFLLKILAAITIVDQTLSQWVINGKVQTFTTATKLSTDFIIFIWSQENQSNWNTKLFYCKNVDMMCDPASNEIVDWYSANITKNTTSYISVFTIKEVNLTLHNTRWLCISVSQSSSTGIADFYLQVYATAENCSCDDVILFNETHIQIQCDSQKIFPESQCHFLVKTNVSPAHDLTGGSVTYQTTQNFNTLYFQTICTYIVSAVKLGPGTHMFRVDVYPNITADLTEEMKRTSDYTRQIVLGYPKAALSSDCKVNSYIRENEAQTCTCYNKNDPSFLPTKVTWSSNDNFNISKAKLGFLSSRSASRPQIFTCNVLNALNWSDNIIYEPTIAYGPDSVDLVICNKDQVICNNEQVNIQGMCQVDNSNPLPIVYVIVNNSKMQLYPGTRKNQYSFNISISTVGIFNVTCEAYNSVFLDISTKKEVSLYVKAWSKVPKITSITNSVISAPLNNIIMIYEGMTTVICEVEEETIIPKNMTLTCGHYQHFVTEKNTVYLILNLTQHIGKMKCQCELHTESRCPMQTAFIDLQIMQVNKNKESEINIAAIILGIMAGIAILILTILFIKFIVQRKIRNHSHTRDSKARDDYSNLKDQYLQDKRQCYEIPTLKQTAVPNELMGKPDTNTDKDKNTKSSGASELGGFIVTEMVNIAENSINDYKNIEYEHQPDKHVYAEVRDT